jgi:tRNA(Ile)-lysidine synthase
MSISTYITVAEGVQGVWHRLPPRGTMGMRAAGRPFPSMLQQVIDTIARYRMFEAGKRAGVAVSGGADSVCLLHALVELAPRWDLRLSVLHLDHGLRGEESLADAGFVGDMAARLGLPFVLRRADLAASPDNLEQAGREARLEFFRHTMRSGTVDRVALGHTRNDQAETVLFRFLRGSGTAGLAGIRPITPDGIVRPLLAVTRGEVERYLRERGIAWREDSTNSSPRFARNRIRNELLPELQLEWNPAIVETLAHTADWAQAEEDYWSAEIARLAGMYCHHRGDAVLLEVTRLTALPEALARRLVRAAIQSVKGDVRGVEFHHITSILGLASAPDGHGRTQAPGIDAFRSFEWLRLAPLARGTDAARNFRLPLAVPGVTGIPGGDSEILTEVIEKSETIQPPECVYNGVVHCLDWHGLSGRLELRNWRPGDQYQPLAHAQEHKIKALFHQARIPLWERRNWPVITDGNAIVWTRRFGPAARFAAGSSTSVVLRLREQHRIEAASVGV